MTQVEQQTNQLNEYFFAGIRFIPGYNDFDVDDITLTASSEEEAWKRLDQLTKLFTWKQVKLVSINAVEI